MCPDWMDPCRPSRPTTGWVFPDVADRPFDGPPTTSSASGADLEPGRCSRPTGGGCSRCPSTTGTPGVLWWSPVRRGVLPLDGLTVSRSLRQSVRRMEVRVDTAFDEVIRACADPVRDGAWIDGEILEAYTRLHRARLGALGRGVAGR